MKIGSVFISHSAKEPDHSLTGSLAKVLESKGLNVWWDKQGLKGGDFFPVEILEAIIRQNFFIFIVSEHSICSEWCLRELTRATELRKDVKPLLLEPIPRERSPLALAGLQYVDIQSGLTDETKAGIFRALGLSHNVPEQVNQQDPFVRDGRLIKALADQLEYAKTFTNTLNMVLLLENIGNSCCETDRAREVIAGMRSDANCKNGMIDYDLVRSYLLNKWRGL